MMKTKGTSAGNPSRFFASSRALAQSLCAEAKACATSERNGSPASNASENLPVSTGWATARC